MGDVVAEVQAPWRFNALLFSVFGALSLLLAAIGVFGVLMCVVIGPAFTSSPFDPP